MAVFLGLATASIVFAQEEEKKDQPNADLNVSFFSQYIWRGYELSRDSLVIFPSLTVGYKGFNVNVWTDMDTHYQPTKAHELWETDLITTYSNSWKFISGTFGWIFYDTDAGDAQELFLILGFDTILTPTLSVWREIQNVNPTWYLKCQLSHRFELNNGWSIDLGGWVSYLDIQDTSDPHKGWWHDGNVYATLNIPLGDYITISPQVNYTFPLSQGANKWLLDANVAGMDSYESQFVYGGIIFDLAI
jgi:hypothetical protein